ncbi:MAG: hypothetical protein A2700_02015 [Candidatus Blackburnbacteria bacterium RIFCSPHIGHO2_01_FULL_44_64]|uniref:Soluble ligand binding domain-containing protein n=1 Tax=Candidatus Blackburnbacteria bacterium RIFCSPHIGHO2_02_FULL_44_20 TaxID=1797516 RepID=A0A1G1VA37_9BACT|nr:MAG: hypothetical protein A2700_02015 [Candidatus Blackburnbacteria bacterium RIFCSPHIGHO2_01_FULL_44_64]OGY10481.1 MAG: hypothetical protein A3E16_04290 [Candidatus Blackburnbacteria bacterium RIFCSPHIGHO2_12_FULL_44_25]OGY12239.1 MAG: hypothetical protein A3D26_02200 [Candidatus Blackburnbacteria bacterium RIFCSPHIGHO2_02_FULL_44_20]OGY15114.1 MAG: hypothetical protein A3A62_00215 [Candidatus Blackburnbacteria bacterium RIFCSPLOWO2_01_FULL_44_43]OGY15232.1 MAG: hypothetical protein A3H88_0
MLVSFDPKQLLEKVEEWIFVNRRIVLLAGGGLLAVLAGIFVYTSGFFNPVKVEVLGTEDSTVVPSKIVVEIAGEVIRPGVYEFSGESRIDELLVRAGGFTANADREWISKSLNRAARLVDGQKIYIPAKGEVVSNVVTQLSGNSGGAGGVVSINTASLGELDKLSGIGQVRAQAIVDNRPYLAVEELFSRKVLPKSVFEKIKDKIGL